MQRKSCVLPVLAAACAAGIASSSKAAQLIYEPFNYTAGAQINGQTNTTSAASETWQPNGPATPLHVVGNSGLSPTAGMLAVGYPAAVGNDGDMKKSGTSSAYDKLSIPNAFDSNSQPIYGAGSTLYYSLLLDVPNISGLTIAHSNPNANNDGLIAFNATQGSSATAPNAWNGELSIRLGSTAGTYNLGVRASTTDPNTTFWTGDLNPGDTHFIVVGATYGQPVGGVNVASSDTNAMWLDPNPSTFGAAVAPAATGSSDGANNSSPANDVMESLIIGAGIATAGAAPADTYLDEIRVGNTWADVTPTPEPATLGLLSLGALGLVTRRRRT